MNTQDDLKQIEAVRALGSYRLAVAWRDGYSAIIDFSADIKSGGVWSRIATDAKFARARIGHHGRVLEWPVPADDEGDPLIDIDADALYALAMEQRAQPIVEAVLQHIKRQQP